MGETLTKEAEDEFGEDEFTIEGEDTGPIDEAAAEKGPEPAASKPKRVTAAAGIIDEDAATLTVDGRTYALADVSQDGLRQLALIGMRAEMRTGRTWESIRDGSGRRLRTGEKSPRTRGLSDWGEAVAQAIVSKTARSKTPHTIEQAREQAKALTKEQMGVMRRDPAVVAAYAHLKQAHSALDDLLHHAAA